jgi:hypothetical protein
MINHKEGASNRSEKHPFREIDAKAKSAPWQPGVYQYTYETEANAGSRNFQQPGDEVLISLVYLKSMQLFDP